MIPDRKEQHGIKERIDKHRTTLYFTCSFCTKFVVQQLYLATESDRRMDTYCRDLLTLIIHIYIL